MSDHTTRKQSTTIEDRFWAKVDRRGPDDCWNWTASTRNKGYGAFCWRNDEHVQIQDRAHRFSYRLHIGEIPDGLFVLHRCDNPACVNPAHLFLGTIADNNIDMVRKGRHVSGGTYSQAGYKRGTKHHNARLTPDIVRALRADRENGMSFGQLAEKYGITTGHTFRIVSREAWSHVS